MQKNMLIVLTITVALFFTISGAVFAEDPCNSPPVANDDCISTSVNTPVVVDVLANDQDPDGDALNICGGTEPNHGTTCVVDGKIQYTPDTDWCGVDSFCYSVSDGKGGTDSATVTVNCKEGETCDRQMDLGVSKVDNPDPVVAGGQLTYVVTVTNCGPSSVLASDILKVSDSLPDGFTATSWTPSAGNYDSNSGAWTGLDLASGESATLTIIGTVNPSATGILTNKVTVTPPAGVTDQYPCNNVATEETTVINAAPLAIIKTTDKPLYNVGDTVLYTIKVTNQGCVPAHNLVITDTIPEGLQYLGSSAGGLYSAGVVQWNLDTLNPGEEVTRTVTGKVLPAAAGTNVVNTATATHEALNEPVKTTASFYVPSADLGITKTVDNPRPMLMDTVIFTLIVNNKGPDTAVNVNVADKLPSGLRYVTSTANFGTYDPESGLWTINSLPKGESAILAITAVAEKSGLIINQADVRALTWDPNLDDNTANASVDVQEPAEPVPVQAKTVTMQKTGAPLGALLVAFLMLISGMAVSRRK